MTKSPYAGFWRRTAAFAIDCILLSVPATLICLPLLLLSLGALAQVPNSEDLAAASLVGWLFLWNILAAVSFWLYFAWQESGPHQATFGKRLLGIKVVGSDGGRIGFGRATGRVCSKFLSYALAYLGFIMAACTNRKRALHDYIAETYVVRADFSAGDELPDTPKHLAWLAVLTVLAALLFTFGMISTIINAEATAEPELSGRASVRLLQLASQRSLLAQPLEENGFTFHRNMDGYRAIRNTEAGYALYLPPGGNKVCCEELSGDSCTLTGVDVCY